VATSLDKANERFQHALAMLAGIVTPPLILGGAGGANLDPADQQYLISASLIVCGILSSIQITRFHFYKTPYYLGTGLNRFTFLFICI
jgi:NCS2 family nucleobase:cation symporter-2